MKPEGPVFDSVWRAECEVVPVDRGEVDWMVRRHYLGKWPGVCVLTMALRHQGRAVGVIVFALPPRETSTRYGGVTWELARLWIDDSIPSNAETYVIAAAARYIKRTRREVKYLVSYADPSVGHSGLIYRAAGWQEDGRTDQGRKTPRFDYEDAVTGKHYSRRSHVPEGAMLRRVPRVSKPRYVLGLGR